MELYQTCLKCDECMFGRPCYFVYVDSVSASGHKEVIDKVNKHGCPVGCIAKFELEYSIPYTGC